MKSLWGGRFTESADAFFHEFNRSFPFDYKLFEADVVGSKAYASGIRDAGILTETEYDQMIAGLDALLTKAETDDQFVKKGIAEGFEDIHAFVESKLSEEVGDLAKKLHTGRSRNDQVATDLRLYLKGEIDHILDGLKSLSSVIVDVAEREQDAYLPGYTHLQRAQPIRFSHFLLSYYEMFYRDRQRFSEIKKRVDVMPLGSGALSGNNHKIDRLKIAKELGFSGITRNSLDATSDRDFVVEFVQAASLAMVHLSRLSEDLILYSSLEFGFVKMSDQVATGSSLMPQKKNPDALELIRGKAGRVFGHEIGLLSMMKGLPSCYNKDMQEDKEALFDTALQLSSCLRVMSTVVSTMEVYPERMKEATKGGFLNATDLADYLVEAGVPFREAHHKVGEIVLYADQAQKTLEDLSLSEYQKFFAGVSEDVYQAVDMERVMDAKIAVGGTNKALVTEALASARRELADDCLKD